MAISIGPRIGIEGEKEFRSALQNIIQQCKTLASESEKVSTAFKKNADAMKSNKDQASALNKQIEAQKNRIEQLEDGLHAATEKFGEGKTQTLKWQEALNKAETELDNLQTKLSDVNRELAKDEFSTASKKVEILESEYEKASTALEKHKSALQQNTNQHKILGQQIDAQKSKIAALKTVYEQSSAALGENADETLEWKNQLIQAETELDNLQWKLKELPSNLQIIGDKMQQIGNSISSLGTSLTAGVTTPLVALGTKAAKSYGEVDKTFRQVKATIGDTSSEEDFQRLWDTMMDEATKSVYDVQDAADALLNYAQAGFSASESADMLHGAFALAAGTGTDMSTVTSGLSVALKAFNEDTSQATRYANVFARGQAQARVTTTGLVDSLSYAAPVFSSLGYSVEDLVAAVGMMGDAGYEGSEAGAALRTGLMRLAAPTDKASTLMEELGLSAADVDEMFDETEGSLEDCASTMEQFGINTQTIFDAQGNIRSFYEVIQSLEQAFDGLTQQEKMEALDKIFGKNRGSAWLSLIDQGSDKLKKLQTNLQDCEGDADAMADALMRGAGGALEKLSSDFDVFTVTLGETLAPTVQEICDKLSGMMDWFLSLDEETQNQIAQAAIAVAALGPVLVVIGTLVSSIGKIVGAMGTAGTAIKSAVTFLKGGGIASTIASISSKIAAIGDSISGVVTAISSSGLATTISGVVGVVGGAILAIVNFVKMLKDGFSWINEILMIVGTAIAAVAAVLLGAPALVAAAVAAVVAVVATAIVQVKDHWNEIKEFFSNLWNGIKETASNAWQGICDTVGSVKDSIVGVWTDFTGRVTEVFSPVIEMMKENWQSFADFFSAIAEWISAIFSGLWDIISALCELGFAFLQSKWTEFSEWITMYLAEWILSIQEYLSMFWAWITEQLTPFIDGIKELIDMFFAWINDTILPLIEGIGNWCLEQWNQLCSDLGELLEEIKSTISDKVDEVKGIVTDTVQSMFDKLGEFLEKAHQWGVDLVENMAAGIRSAAHKIKDAASGVASKIRSYIHFSEPDEGPLSDFHTYMPDMMSQLAQGMLDNRFVVSDAALTVAGDIAENIQPTTTTNNTNVGGVTIVVNGAEGQDVNELADIVMEKINNQFVRTRVAFG